MEENLNLMQQFWLALIGNADKISAAVAFMIITGVIVYLLWRIFNSMASVIDRISERAEAQAQREDVFQTRLLDLHTKTVNNNDKITSLMDKHENAARERSLSQEQRDQERLEFSRKQTDAMTKIINYLGVLGETKIIVDNVETTVTRMQGHVADMQTDLPALITRKAGEAHNDIETVVAAINRNYELTGRTLDNITKQLAKMTSTIEDTNQARAIHTLSETLGIVLSVVTNSHKLVESIPATLAAMSVLTIQQAPEQATNETIGETTDETL